MTTYTMDNLNSSLLSAAQYDSDARVLTLTFKSNKATYDYADVTQDDWNAFASAQSQGSHFLKHIKPFKLCTRIE